MINAVGHCSECDVPMVSKTAWSKGMRPEGHAAHGGRGLCRRHHAQAARRGDLPENESYRRTPKRDRIPRPMVERAPARSRAEVIEDYLTIRDEVDSLEDAARRIGMGVAALDQALYRARKDGITEAKTPNQLRGSHHNQHHNATRRAA